jgi:hypothetical protein
MVTIYTFNPIIISSTFISILLKLHPIYLTHFVHVLLDYYWVGIDWMGRVVVRTSIMVAEQPYTIILQCAVSLIKGQFRHIVPTVSFVCKVIHHYQYIL